MVEHKHNRTTWRTDLTWLSLMVGVFYFLFLGSRALNLPDEGRYISIPWEMLKRGDFITPHLNGLLYFEKPPLFYWLQSGMIALFGMNEWSWRAINTLLGISGVLMTYATARELCSRRVGWLAAAVLGSSWLYYAMSRYVTLDLAVTVFLTAALFSFMHGNRCIPGPTRSRWMWLMYAFAALATLTKGLIGLVFPPMIIAVWLTVTGQWRHIKTYCLPTGLLLFFAIATPWHLLVQLKNPSFFDFYFIKEHLLRYATHFADREQPFGYLPLVTLLGFLPWSALLPTALWQAWPRPWHDRKKLGEKWFLVLWPTLILLFFSQSHSLLIPYVLPVFPPLAILIARCIDRYWTAQRARPILILLLFNAFFAVAAVSALFFFIKLEVAPDPLLATIFLGASGAILLLASFSALMGYARYGVMAAILATLIGQMSFLTTLNLSSDPFNRRSIKPIALLVKTQLKPGDTVFSYRNYYQDFPAYAQHRLVIVQWYNELRFGFQHQADAKDRIIDIPRFWKRWHSAERAFMIVAQDDYKRLLKAQPDLATQKIAETHDNVLLFNAAH